MVSWCHTPCNCIWLLLYFTQWTLPPFSPILKRRAFLFSFWVRLIPMWWKRRNRIDPYDLGCIGLDMPRFSLSATAAKQLQETEPWFPWVAVHFKIFHERSAKSTCQPRICDSFLQDPPFVLSQPCKIVHRFASCCWLSWFNIFLIRCSSSVSIGSIPRKTRLSLFSLGTPPSARRSFYNGMPLAMITRRSGCSFKLISAKIILLLLSVCSNLFGFHALAD